MIGRILFLSGAAFLAYRYISNSNKKARQLREAAGNKQTVLPAAHEPAITDSARILPSGSATEESRASRAVIDNSAAVEPRR